MLGPYLENRASTSYCFDPRDAKPKRAGVRYTSASYRTAVKRACVRAGVPEWSPNRLRHSRATDLRRRYGVEDTRTILGHSKVGTTEIYAAADHARAAAIMGEIG